MPGIDWVRRGVAAALLASLLLMSNLSQAAEAYEGAWARTAKECKQQEGATSLTVIGLDIKIDGKPRAMVEQYENHCFIDNKSTMGRDAKLKATCYEFWDDFKNKTGGRKKTIRLSVVSKDVLTIDGKPHLRCYSRSLSKKL